MSADRWTAEDIPTVFRPGWLQEQVNKCVESLNRLPEALRDSLSLPTRKEPNDG